MSEIEGLHVEQLCTGSNQNIAIRPTAGDVDLKKSGRSPHKVEVNSFCSLLLCFEEQFFPVKLISRE